MKNIEQSRRHFLKALAGTSAGLALAGELQGLEADTSAAASRSAIKPLEKVRAALHRRGGPGFRPRRHDDVAGRRRDRGHRRQLRAFAQGRRGPREECRPQRTRRLRPRRRGLQADARARRHRHRDHRHPLGVAHADVRRRHARRQACLHRSARRGDARRMLAVGRDLREDGQALHDDGELLLRPRGAVLLEPLPPGAAWANCCTARRPISTISAAR